MEIFCTLSSTRETEGEGEGGGEGEGLMNVLAVINGLSAAITNWLCF